MCLGATLFYALFSTVRYPKAKQDKSSKKRYEVGGEYIHIEEIKGGVRGNRGEGVGNLIKWKWGNLIPVVFRILEAD